MIMNHVFSPMLANKQTNLKECFIKITPSLMVCHLNEFFLQKIFCTCILMFTYMYDNASCVDSHRTASTKSILFWTQIGFNYNAEWKNLIWERHFTENTHTNLLVVRKRLEKLEFSNNVGKIDRLYTPLRQLPAITWRHAGDVTLRSGGEDFDNFFFL